MKFIHSGDWQIGMRFQQFGEKSEGLRAERVQTLRRSLEHAEAVRADAFLIAGDLFEDNQIDPAQVREVFELLAGCTAVPIFILPGNHDPCDGPGCIWNRAPFAQSPPHLTILRTPQVLELAGAWLLANPLLQKKSTTDPTAVFTALAATLPADAIRIGLTHGSPAIESQHAPDDFPIALNAASRAGLDYLALGHWHSSLTLDEGRLVMPGTPEPASFSDTQSGQILEVEITATGAPPRITPVRVAGLQWVKWEHDCTEPVLARARLAQQLAGVENLTRSVVHLRLHGEASPEIVAAERAWLETQLASAFLTRFADETTVALTEAALLDLRSRHPLAAEVLDELHRLSTGQISSGDLAEISAQAGVPLEHLNARVAGHAQRLVLRELREVLGEC